MGRLHTRDARAQGNSPRIRRVLPRVIPVAACVVALALPGAATAQASSSVVGDRDTGPWSSVFSLTRPVPAASTTRRVIIRFEDPSLSEWRNGRNVSARSSRRYLAQAQKRQDERISALRAAGVQISIEHRYLRVLNGVSAVLPRHSELVARSVSGVRSIDHVRFVYPAVADHASGPASSAVQAASSISPQSVNAVTVSLLDTGVDFNHAALAPIQASAGHDVLAGQDGVEPARGDEHGTAVAGAIAAGGGGAVRIESVRVLSSRPSRTGGSAVYGSSDDVIAGLEHVVDRNSDGDVTDSTDVALIASSTPYASFAGEPLADAADGASGLGVVVVAAAGNDGGSGDEVGTIGAPASADAALVVGAADARTSRPIADVRIAGGALDRSFGAVPVLTGDTTGLPKASLDLVSTSGAATDVLAWYDADLSSRVTSKAALIERAAGISLAAQVRAAADAGAALVIVAGVTDGEASGIVTGVGVNVPAIGIPADAFADAERLLRSGVSVQVEVNAVASGEQQAPSLAGFSSRGASFDGRMRPDIVAPGVAFGTAVPGSESQISRMSGTSIAAGFAAGVVASIRAEHPTWGPDQVRSAVTGSAQTLGSAQNRAPLAGQGSGLVQPDAARQATLFSQPSRVDAGVMRPGTALEIPLSITGSAGNAVSYELRLETAGGDGVSISRTGQGIVVSVANGTAPGAYGGWLVVSAGDLASQVRVPWSAVVAGSRTFDVPITMTAPSAMTVISSAKPNDNAEVQLVVGGLPIGGSLGLRGAQAVRFMLIDSTGKELGPTGHLQRLLPGVYRFGVVGVGPDGNPLEPGSYRLRADVQSAADPNGDWIQSASVGFSVTAR